MTCVSCVIFLFTCNSTEKLEALLQRWQWDDARTRCEVWAYKRDTCDCTTGIISLAGFAEGGGPPRACLQAMTSELREGYCKALRWVIFVCRVAWCGVV